VKPEIGLLVKLEPRLIQNSQLLEMMEKGSWQSEKELNQRKEFFKWYDYLKEDAALIWVVLTPGFPQQNAAFNVNFSTAQIMRNELKNGWKLQKKKSYNLEKFRPNRIRARE
jgi:hypothetical protein